MSNTKVKTIRNNRKPKEVRKIQALQPLKVDELGIGENVLALREIGLSFLKIATQINETQLVGTGQKISPMSVMRWCNRNVPDDYANIDENAVNIYRHAVNLMHALDSQLELLDTYIDSFSKEATNQKDIVAVSRQVTAYMNTYEKLSNRKVALLGTIQQMQEKVYSFSAVSRYVEILLERIKEKDIGLYAEVLQEIKTDPLLIECYRKIQK